MTRPADLVDSIFLMSQGFTGIALNLLVLDTLTIILFLNESMSLRFKLWSSDNLIPVFLKIKIANTKNLH
jgi:hypothetical protein